MVRRQGRTHISVASAERSTLHSGRRCSASSLMCWELAESFSNGARRAVISLHQAPRYDSRLGWLACCKLGSP